MAQITHQADDDGHMRQIVSAETLRDILIEDGDTLEKPKWLSADDEWDVGDDDTDSDDDAADDQWSPGDRG